MFLIPKNSFSNTVISKAHYVFFCLLFLSLFRPQALLHSFNYSLSAPALLLSFIFLFIKIKGSIGFKLFTQRYKIELILILSYQLLCILSLLLNVDRFDSTSQLIILGITPIVVQALLPICIFLFIPYTKNKNCALRTAKNTGLILVFITVCITSIAVLQAIDTKIVYSVYRFFIAGNLGLADNVRSVFAISTDLGSISGLVLIFSFLMAIKLTRHNKCLLGVYSLIILLSITSGILSGARIFIFSTGCALVTFVIFFYWNQKKRLLTNLLMGALILLLLVQLTPPYTATKLADVFPFITYLHAGLIVLPQDFIPTITVSALGDRAFLWSSALEHIFAHPLTGISNGGFKIINSTLGGTTVNNTHNAIFQSAIDGGIFATVILLTLVLRVAKKARSGYQLAITAGVVSTLLVDNFIDHSLPWIIIASYIVTQSYHIFESEYFKNSCTTVRVPNKTMTLVLFLLILAVLGKYSLSALSFSELSDDEKAEQLHQYFLNVSFDSPPAAITPKFNEVFNTSIQSLNLLPIIDLAHRCYFKYPKTLVFAHYSERGALRGFRLVSENWGIGYLAESECHTKLIKNNISPKKWISNHRAYTEHWIKGEKSRIVLMYDNIVLYSPTFKVENAGNLLFFARGNNVNSTPATLLLELHNSKDNSLVYKKQIELDEKEKKYTIPLPLNKQGHVFLKARLVDYQVNQLTSEYHTAWLKGFIFEQE